MFFSCINAFLLLPLHYQKEIKGFLNVDFYLLKQCTKLH